MSLVDDLGVFARVQRALRDPFARREAVLRAEQIDESTLARAERHWAERLGGADGGPLRDELARLWRGEAAPATPGETDEDERPPVAPETGSTRAALPDAPLVPSYLLAAEGSRRSPLQDDHEDETQLPVRRAGPTLPFQPGTPGEVPLAVQVHRGASLREPRPPPCGDETAVLGLPLQAMISAAAASSGSAPEWSLEAYARFLVAFARVSPPEADALRRAHGLGSEAEQQVLGASFAAWFVREPAQRATFDALLARLREEAMR